jgi:hypothetical protein
MRAGGRKRATGLIIGRERGNTLNIGARISKWYGRVYDKYRESGDEQYVRCWRYEVEGKGDAAEALRAHVNAAQEPATEIPAMVAAWFGDRGVDVRYRPGMAHSFEAIPASPVDDLRTLAWLRAAASPALARLGERYTREALIAWLFDSATMEHMKGDREAVRQIAERYLDRMTPSQ